MIADGCKSWENRTIKANIACSIRVLSWILKWLLVYLNYNQKLNYNLIKISLERKSRLARTEMHKLTDSYSFPVQTIIARVYDSLLLKPPVFPEKFYVELPKRVKKFQSFIYWSNKHINIILSINLTITCTILILYSDLIRCYSQFNWPCMEGRT